MKVVLFLCTGNYYRSRFAEEMFNFLGPVKCPGWAAVSRIGRSYRCAKKAEHFPLLQERFPSWIGTSDPSRIEYWHIHDIDQMAPEEGLPLIARQVQSLMKRLKRGRIYPVVPKTCLIATIAISLSVPGGGIVILG